METGVGVDALLHRSDLAGTTKVGSTTFTYDATGCLTSLQHRDDGGDLFANYTYTYDVASRLTTEVLNGTPLTFTYDATHQLTDDIPSLLRFCCNRWPDDPNEKATRSFT